MSSRRNDRKIRCPMCGHELNNRIEFGSHIKRCKASKTAFNWKNPSKPKKNRFKGRK